jgi:hypothetical protein
MSASINHEIAVCMLGVVALQQRSLNSFKALSEAHPRNAEPSKLLQKENVDQKLSQHLLQVRQLRKYYSW